MVSQQIKIAMVAAALVAFAYIVPHSGSFVVLLATRAMAFAILAMSVDLLLGYTGLASMGQAAYFGIGAYLTAILAAKFHFGLGWDFWLVVVLGILIGAFLATARDPRWPPAGPPSPGRCPRSAAPRCRRASGR